MATAKKPCFLHFLLFTYSPTIVQSLHFYKQLIQNFCKQISVVDIPT